MEMVARRENTFWNSILKIALPVTLQSMLRASFSIIDQIMIGQLGSASIAGIGLGGKFASIHGVVLGGITATAAIMISQYMGQRNHRKVERSFYVNLLVALVLAGMFTTVSEAFTKPIMSCYTKDELTRGIAEDYLRIYAISFGFAAISGMVETMLSCMEAAVFSLIASITSLLINTALNYILIFGKLGLAPLGVRGAAIGSVVAQIVSCMLTITFLLWQLKKRKKTLRFTVRFEREEKRAYVAILVPLLLCEFLWSLGENVYSGIYGNIGTKACAAMTVTSPIQCLMIGALCGLSQAAGIMVGKSLGNQNYEEAYETSKKLMKYGLLASLVLSAWLVLLGRSYVGIYNVEEEVKQMAYYLLVVFAVVSPVKVQNMILGGGIIRSGGKTNYILAIDLIGTWGFGVPLGLLAAFVFHLNVVYVYLILSMEECVRLAISLVLFKRRSWMQKI